MRKTNPARLTLAIALMALALAGCIEPMEDEMLEADEIGETALGLSSPIGFHDSSAQLPEELAIRSTGWACDPDNYAAPLYIHFYEERNGNPYYRYLGAAYANQPREAGVAAACGGYTAHGFVFDLPASAVCRPMDQYSYVSVTIRAYAIDLNGGPNPPLTNTGIHAIVPCSPGVVF